MTQEEYKTELEDAKNQLEWLEEEIKTLAALNHDADVRIEYIKELTESLKP